MKLNEINKTIAIPCLGQQLRRSLSACTRAHLADKIVMAEQIITLSDVCLLHQTVHYQYAHHGPVRFSGAPQPNDAILKSKADVS